MGMGMGATTPVVSMVMVGMAMDLIAIILPMVMVEIGMGPVAVLGQEAGRIDMSTFMTIMKMKAMEVFELDLISCLLMVDA